jgi:glutamate/tyrosine decarboxylase-like PLP-dependent enzyme
VTAAEVPVSTIFASALRRAFDASVSYLDGLDDAPVGPTATRADLLARLGRPLTDEGAAPEAVIDDLVADVDAGLMRSPGGRFYAWVIGGSVPAALAADWLTSTWDQNAGLFAVSPAAAVVEEVAGAWLKDLLGLPASSAFALVTGCQMAHFTCLAAARNRLLADRGWDVERRGLVGAPPIRVLTNDQYHSTLPRALRHLGLGTDCVATVPATARGGLDPTALEAALRDAPDTATVVHLQAGDLNTGIFEDFAALIPLARAHGAWVHVDAAFGLWAAASPRYRHLTVGLADADSWATDGHKWLNVPYDCGYAFVARPEALRAAMSVRASYLTHADEARDQMDWTPEFSRRARGFATYAAIRQLGRRGIADLVERCCAHAHALTTRIGALDGAELLWEPIINQGLVRFPSPEPGATPQDHDRRTDEVIAAVTASGEAFFSGTTWRGMRCMRISVSGWMTTAADVDRVVQCVRDVLRRT